MKTAEECCGHEKFGYKECPFEEPSKMKTAEEVAEEILSKASLSDPFLKRARMPILVNALTAYAEERVKEGMVLRAGAMQAELNKNFEANCQRIRAEALEEVEEVVEEWMRGTPRNVTDSLITKIRALKGGGNLPPAFKGKP